MFPSWVPGELLPGEVEDLTEQFTAATRGYGGTRNPHLVFSDERPHLERYFRMARTLVGMEIPW